MRTEQTKMSGIFEPTVIKIQIAKQDELHSVKWELTVLSQSAFIAGFVLLQGIKQCIKTTISRLIQPCLLILWGAVQPLQEEGGESRCLQRSEV